jgi:hypothetical protein
MEEIASVIADLLESARIFDYLDEGWDATLNFIIQECDAALKATFPAYATISSVCEMAGDICTEKVLAAKRAVFIAVMTPLGIVALIKYMIRLWHNLPLNIKLAARAAGYIAQGVDEMYDLCRKYLINKIGREAGRLAMQLAAIEGSIMRTIFDKLMDTADASIIALLDELGLGTEGRKATKALLALTPGGKVITLASAAQAMYHGDYTKAGKELIGAVSDLASTGASIAEGAYEAGESVVNEIGDILGL